MTWKDKNLIQILQNGGVVVMPTDTLYGIVGRAEDMGVVERIYEIRKRKPEKPCIILISDIRELEKFDIVLSDAERKQVEKFKEPTSFVLDCKKNQSEKFAYLHRGTKTLAFRIPYLEELRDLLLKTGPLIAPSANIEASEPSKNVEEAKKYFSNEVDLYVDGGEIIGKASKVIRLSHDGSFSVLRE